jgi:hypothetical protein
MWKVVEIDAEGKGLFKFDDDIKARLGEILQMLANRNNEAGRFNLAFRILVLSTLTFALLNSANYHSIIIQTPIVYS